MIQYITAETRRSETAARGRASLKRRKNRKKSENIYAVGRFSSGQEGPIVI
jgi:hypothetical protein